MADENSVNESFLKKLDKVIEENLANEQFRVTELAEMMGMSRYTLHRRINEATKLSVSQYIRQVRLKNAMKLLREKSLSVSEIAFKVGFGSPVYFSKCFHEYYGYPPNTVGKREEEKLNEVSDFIIRPKKNRFNTIIIASLFLILVTIILFFLIKPPYTVKDKEFEKSVVFLYPLYNISDSSYVHQINGTVDAILNNLSMVGELTVFPMSVTLKYKNSDKSGIEIARELHAGYIVESSGISYGNKVRLNIKLINASDGIQVWYSPYEINTNEIIQLPLEVARTIANEIKAKITPEEKRRMDTEPTQSTEAWNFYLKGVDFMNTGLSLYYGTGVAGNTGNNIYKGMQSFEDALTNFKTAIQYDENFAFAYAQMAITYYLMDIGKNEGKFTSEINTNADLAILNDAQHDLCLLAKAYDYVNRGENKMGIPFLEKALKFNPKSVVAYRLLADVYSLTREANSEKYLEYKLQVIKWGNFAEGDNRKSEDYRLAARALRVTGFNQLALEYINKSLQLNPENYSALGEKCEIIIEGENNYIKARNILNEALSNDSSSIEIIRFLFTNYYLTKDFEEAYKYFKLFSGEDKNLSFLATKDFSRLTVLFAKLNMQKESQEYLNRFRTSDRSKLNSYSKNIELLRLYSLENDKDKAFEQLNLLNKQPYHFSYTLRMLNDDPVFDNIRDSDQFKIILSDMESKFEFNKKKIERDLEKKGLF